MSSQSHGDISDTNANSTGQGPNSWFIDELYQQYLDNPRSVPDQWQDIFAQGPPGTIDATTPTEGRTVRLDALPPDMVGQQSNAETAPPSSAEPAPAPTQAAPAAAPSPAAPERLAATSAPAPEKQAPTPAPAPDRAAGTTTAGGTNGSGGDKATERSADVATEETAADDEHQAEVLRGVSALIASNMESSLEVPTATSFREVPAKLLEVNRTILNNHLRRVRGGKVSFTHIIGYAVVKAITSTVPNLNNTYRTNDDGKPELVRNKHVNLGIAVDMEKDDGSRTLMVPVIKKADTLDFSEFVDAYEALIEKVRLNKMTVDDLTGATVTLTNPGTIGTVQSVPRLMKGQGAIIGVGRIGFPTEYQAADPKMLAHLGISKIIAITSTYDHPHHSGRRIGHVPEEGTRAAVG